MLWAEGEGGRCAGAEEFFELAGSEDSFGRAFLRGAWFELISEDGVEDGFDNGDGNRGAVFVDEVGELEVGPGGVIGVGVVEVDVPVDPEAIEHVVMHPEDGIEGREECAHVAADPAVNIVVGCALEDAVAASGVGGQASGRLVAGEESEAGIAENVLDDGGTDPRGICGIGGADVAVAVEESVGRLVAPEGRRNGGAGGPVPVGQREGVVAGDLAADALEVEKVGAMPREEEPAAMRTFVEVNVGLRSPTDGVTAGERLHGGDRSAISRDDGVSWAETRDVFARGTIFDLVETAFTTTTPEGDVERGEGAGAGDEVAARE